jgi:hypothetical protein
VRGEVYVRELTVVPTFVRLAKDFTASSRDSIPTRSSSKDVIVVTAEEVEKYRDVVGTLIYPALREGKVLYE